MMSCEEEMYFLLNTSQCYYERSHRCNIFDVSNQTLCYYSVVPCAQLICIAFFLGANKNKEECGTWFPGYKF